jgi:hypothetical protein
MKEYLFLSIFLFICFFDTILTKKDKEKQIDNDSEFLDFDKGYITLPFTLTKSKIPISKLSIGKPSQEINLVLDIGSSRTWISDQYYNNKGSKTYQPLEEAFSKEQYDFSYSGNSALETFKIGDKILQNFKFILVNNLQNNNFQGVLSLGHEYDSKHNSLVYEMSKVSNTYYNMFMFKFNEDNGGELLIGDTTEEEKEKLHLINRCRYLIGGSPEEQIKWRCQLTHVFIGGIEDMESFYEQLVEQTGYYIIETKFNKLKNIYEPVIFETIFDRIYVPKYIMEYLRDNYLKDIENNKNLCNYNDNGNSIIVKCTKEEISKLKRLNFVLGEKTDLALPSNELFNCDNSNNCEFLIQYNDKYQGFIFGLPIFKLYNIIFDYNSRDLMFYSLYNKYLVSFNKDFGTSILKIVLYILIVVLCLLISGIILIYFFRRINRKRKLIEDEIYKNF